MEPLKRSEIEGLEESIDIVSKNIGLITLKNKKHVADALKFSVEIAKIVGARVPEEAIKETQKEELTKEKNLIKDAMNKIKEIRKEVTNQRNTFKALQGEEVIDDKALKDLEESLRGLEGVKAEKEIKAVKFRAKGFLKDIKDRVAIERTMGRKQGRALQYFVQEQNKIAPLLNQLTQITSALFKYTEMQDRDRLKNPLITDNLFLAAEQLWSALENDLKELFAKEEAQKATIWFIVRLVEERKKEEEILKGLIDTYMNQIEQLREGTNLPQEIERIKGDVEIRVGNIKAAEQGITGKLQELQGQIQEIHNALVEVEEAFVKAEFFGKKEMEEKKKFWQVWKK